MTPRPQNPVPLDYRAASVYFEVYFDSDEAEYVVGHPDEFEPEQVEAAARVADDPDLVDRGLRSAVAEIEKALGVRVTVYTLDHRVGFDCQLPVQSWFDVDRVHSWIQINTVGGDDVVQLAPLFTQAAMFVLYPQGVNGPRFGSGHNQSISEWLDATRPKRLVSTLDEPEPDTRVVAVCDWPDGSVLRRVLCHGQAEWRARFDLVSHRGWVEATLDLEDVGQDVFPAAEVSFSDVNPRAVRRLAWFLWTSTPEHLRELPRDTLDVYLDLPLMLPDQVEALEQVEADALALHERIVRGDCGPSPAMVSIVAGLLGVGRHKLVQNEGDPSYAFELEPSGPIFLFHGPLRLEHRKQDAAAHSAVMLDLSSYHPPWSVYTDRVLQEGTMTWYVVTTNDQVVGAGPTPAQALRDVPNLVWPGRFQEWAAQRFDPGRFQVDPEVYLLLGTWPNYMRSDREFLEDYEP